MADVIAKMSYLYYNHQCWYLYGRCYCQVADGIATLVIVLADVIAKWQMEWPLQAYIAFGQKQNYRIIFSDTPSRCIRIMMSNISSDMNKPCWKLEKACPQSQILFCSRENNLPTILKTEWETSTTRKMCAQGMTWVVCILWNILLIQVLPNL